MANELEAIYLYHGKWAVRPHGQLGTMGWYPKPWTVYYCKARTEAEAIAKCVKDGGVFH